MGYRMSRTDDGRLDGPGSVEIRRESFCLRMPDMFVHGEMEEGGATLEITYAAARRMMELVAVAMAAGADEGELEPPTEEQLAAWQREEDDAKLIEAGRKLTDADLHRLLELRQAASAALLSKGDG